MEIKDIVAGRMICEETGPSSLLLNHFEPKEFVLDY